MEIFTMNMVVYMNQRIFPISQFLNILCHIPLTLPFSLLEMQCEM